jgi:hypothetical protein
MVIIESNYIHSPTTSVRRAVLMGAQALSFGLGNPYDAIDQARFGKNNYMSWWRRSDDYGNIKGICGGAVLGISKNSFDSKDHGTVVITSWAAQH